MAGNGLKYRVTATQQPDGRYLLAREMHIRDEQWKRIYSCHVASLSHANIKQPDWVRDFIVARFNLVTPTEGGGLLNGKGQAAV